MSRICLIRCPSPFLIDEWVFPPIGLMAVGTGLKIRGHDVMIHDESIMSIPMDYQYYGFGPTSPEYAVALEAKNLIKRYNPAAKIIIGGPYATICSDICINDGWDCVVWGDGEEVTEQAFLGNSKLVKAESKPLDDYLMPDRTFFDLRKYKCHLEGLPATTIVTSRGCPFHCAFCCKNYSKVRLLSAERVIEEIDNLYNQHGYRALLFPEDIFIINRERAEKVCKHLKRMGIVWRCLVRGDIIVKYGQDFVHMMRDSGLVEVGMGVESGSQKILDIINKCETIETIKKAIRILKLDGVRVKGFFIIGLPGESQETIAETLKFLDEMKLDDIDTKIYQPYPGSPIWDNQHDYDIEWHDQDPSTTFYKGRPQEYYGNIKTSSLTTDQIYKAWVEMETKYKRFFPIVACQN
jgi:anaerobic magnesium-protoporphyrin IX monomethyl ester cyclase